MEDKMIDLRLDLEQRSTQQLADMLHAETEKETPDDDLVLLVLDILEKRDADKPVELGPKSQAAWQKYQAKARARGRKPLIHMNLILKVASFILIGSILIAAFLPQQATAGSFWKILSSWTEDLFQYENIGAEETAPEEYVFESDNPGLVQLYETVVEELGITEPVVPMWLPDGNELIELVCSESPAMKCVHARFQNGETETILMFDKMVKDLSPTYYKAENQVVKFERNGIIHNFVQNNEVWLISWTRQNIKCSISIDCQEDILKDIVKSIY